jgi:hypothetical protein
VDAGQEVVRCVVSVLPRCARPAHCTCAALLTMQLYARVLLVDTIQYSTYHHDYRDVAGILRRTYADHGAAGTRIAALRAGRLAGTYRFMRDRRMAAFCTLRVRFAATRSRVFGRGGRYSAGRFLPYRRSRRRESMLRRYVCAAWLATSIFLTLAGNAAKTTMKVGGRDAADVDACGAQACS